jgi:hypothetical protein
MTGAILYNGSTSQFPNSFLRVGGIYEVMDCLFDPQGTPRITVPSGTHFKNHFSMKLKEG